MTIAPEVAEQFAPWSGSPPKSPDGKFRINGPWVGTGGNFMSSANAQFVTHYPGSSDGDVLALTVSAHLKQGAELQSLPLGVFGYGYYEASMKITPVSGVVVSFFTIQAPNYGPQEIDIEFLTNEAGFDSSASHVHFTLHPSGMTFDQPLPFNPTTSFHDYGFLWTPGKVQFTVDGKVVHTFIDPKLVITPGTSEYLMANTWTGNPNWGGGPPTQAATSEYDWIKYWANVTTVPDGSGTTTSTSMTATDRDGTTGNVPVITNGSSSITVGIGKVLQSVFGGVDTVSLVNITAESLTLGSGDRDMRFISPHLLTVIGGSGDDTIAATNGTNHFTAGTGTLDVTSGTGWSAYFYHAGDGLLRIEDFTTKDTITIDKSLKGSLAEGSDGHGGVMLSFGVPGHGIDLVGVTSVPASRIYFS